MNFNIKQHQIMTGLQTLLLHQVCQVSKKRRRDPLVITSITYVESGASLKILQGLSGFLGTRYTGVCKFGIQYLPVVT